MRMISWEGISPDEKISSSAVSSSMESSSSDSSGSSSDSSEDSSSSTVSSDSSEVSSSSSSAEFDYYVDAVNGSNSSGGTTPATAFKTITYAVSQAGINKKIKVLPGLYDTAGNGETFPITLLEGQELTGDPDEWGDGTAATEITGSGAVGSTSYYAAFVCGENSVITGFKIGNTFYQSLFFCIYIGDVSASVLKNTLMQLSSYGGVILENSGSAKNINIADNFISTASYGIYIYVVEANINISQNVLVDSKIDVVNASTATLIYDNLFSGAGGGTFAVMVENGYPVIQENTFDNPGGYGGQAAIYCQYAANPKIRGNDFNCVNAIKTMTNANTADPDIGTSGDPGFNDFTHVTGYVINKGDNNASINLYAIGNTWPVYPPVLDTHVYIEAVGDRVYYGTGASDYLVK